MAKKREKLDRIFSVPMTAAMKAAIERLADLDERRPAEFARRLLRGAIDAEMERRAGKGELVGAK
jgi:hypothetical protein